MCAKCNLTVFWGGKPCIKENVFLCFYVCIDHRVDLICESKCISNAELNEKEIKPVTYTVHSPGQREPFTIRYIICTVCQAVVIKVFFPPEKVNHQRQTKKINIYCLKI